MRFVLLLLALLITGCAEAHPRDYALRLEFEGGGTCSGTAVGERLILSATHCWKGGRLVAINGQPAYAMKIKHDGMDHALVRVTVKFDRWARMGKAPVQEQRLRLVGHVWGLRFQMYREAVVAAVSPEDRCPFMVSSGIPKCALILSVVSVDAGDSGAGYFNDAGQIVAVHTGSLRSPAGTYFAAAIPLAFTREDWEAVA